MVGIAKVNSEYKVNYIFEYTIISAIVLILS